MNLKLLRETIHMILTQQERPIVPGAGIIVVRKFNGRWKVLGLKKDGIYDIPKGGIDPGESTLHTALRETQEEAGIQDLKFTWGYRTIVNSELTTFLAESDEDPFVVPNPETGIMEHESAHWLEWNDLYNNTLEFVQPAVSWAKGIVERTG
jgi:8-oxo-dGTP pyrophosphatase MutT (NUDIX family)